MLLFATIFFVVLMKFLFIFSEDAKYLCEDKPISTVSAGKNWLSVGSQDGYVYILNLNGLEVSYHQILIVQ